MTLEDVGDILPLLVLFSLSSLSSSPCLLLISFGDEEGGEGGWLYSFLHCVQSTQCKNESILLLSLSSSSSLLLLVLFSLSSSCLLSPYLLSLSSSLVILSPCPPLLS